MGKIEIVAQVANEKYRWVWRVTVLVGRLRWGDERKKPLRKGLTKVRANEYPEKDVVHALKRAPHLIL